MENTGTAVEVKELPRVTQSLATIVDELDDVLEALYSAMLSVLSPERPAEGADKEPSTGYVTQAGEEIGIQVVRLRRMTDGAREIRHRLEV